MTTNVPVIVFSPTGITLPAEIDILNGELADMNSAFGGNMSVSLTSPQGQLAQSIAAIVGDKNDQIAELVNQIDPNFADGKFQDAIGQFYFMTRIAAAGSVVTAHCIGLVGASIPAGSLAQDAAGYLWASQASATIGSSGFVDISFQCQTTGPVALGIGALATIYAAVTGWESITNVAAAVEGTNVESRADFEYRRKNSVAANAKGSTQAILGSVLAVANVLDAYVIDNPTNAAVSVGATNYSVAPNSVYIAVVGGLASDVANAIWKKKDLGCSYNGNTSATVIDEANNGQPQYFVTWETPAALPIFFRVNIANNPDLPANIVALVKQAILAAFNGQDNGARARISLTLYAGRYYAGIYGVDTNVSIVSLFLGVSASPTTTAQKVGIDQEPTLAASNIVVALV